MCVLVCVCVCVIYTKTMCPKVFRDEIKSAARVFPFLSLMRVPTYRHSVYMLYWYKRTDTDAS